MKKVLMKLIIADSLSSQLKLVQPERHSHSNPLGLVEHVPPFRHG